MREHLSYIHNIEAYRRGIDEHSITNKDKICENDFKLIETESNAVRLDILELLHIYTSKNNIVHFYLIDEIQIWGEAKKGIRIEVYHEVKMLCDENRNDVRACERVHSSNQKQYLYLYIFRARALLKAWW